MFLKKYGRLPPKKKKAAGPLGRLNGGDRKFFDSADHAMGAAGIKVGGGGKTAPVPVETGSIIATADNIKKDKPARPPSMVDHTAQVIASPEKTTPEPEANQEGEAAP